MLEDKKRPWEGSEAVHWNTCWKLLWKKLRGWMNDGKRRGLMQLSLVNWFLNWNSQDISGFILISVSEYSNIPSSSLEAFRWGIYEQTKQPACCLGYQSIDLWKCREASLPRSAQWNSNHLHTGQEKASTSLQTAFWIGTKQIDHIETSLMSIKTVDEIYWKVSYFRFILM